MAFETAQCKRISERSTFHPARICAFVGLCGRDLLLYHSTAKVLWFVSKIGNRGLSTPKQYLGPGRDESIAAGPALPPRPRHCPRPCFPTCLPSYLPSNPCHRPCPPLGPALGPALGQALGVAHGTASFVQQKVRNDQERLINSRFAGHTKAVFVSQLIRGTQFSSQKVHRPVSFLLLHICVQPLRRFRGTNMFTNKMSQLLVRGAKKSIAGSPESRCRTFYWMIRPSVCYAWLWITG